MSRPIFFLIMAFVVLTYGALESVAGDASGLGLKPGGRSTQADGTAQDDTPRQEEIERLRAENERLRKILKDADIDPDAVAEPKPEAVPDPKKPLAGNDAVVSAILTYANTVDRLEKADITAAQKKDELKTAHEELTESLRKNPALVRYKVANVRAVEDDNAKLHLTDGVIEPTGDDLPTYYCQNLLVSLKIRRALALQIDKGTEFTLSRAVLIPSSRGLIVSHLVEGFHGRQMKQDVFRTDISKGYRAHLGDQRVRVVKVH